MPIVAFLHGIICQIISIIGIIMIPATLVVECESAYLTIRAVSVHSLYMVLHKNSDFYNFLLFFSVCLQFRPPEFLLLLIVPIVPSRYGVEGGLCLLILRL